MQLSAVYNNNTPPTATITYSEFTGNSFLLCWSNTAVTSGYDSLFNAGQYDLISNSSGTHIDDDPPTTEGSTRYYYAVDVYEYSLIASTSVVVPASTTISDFSATATTATSVTCTFTLPQDIDTAATIQWQRTTTDPDGGTTPAWTTLATTDIFGEVQQ